MNQHLTGVLVGVLAGIVIRTGVDAVWWHQGDTAVVCLFATVVLMSVAVSTFYWRE